MKRFLPILALVCTIGFGADSAVATADEARSTASEHAQNHASQSQALTSQTSPPSSAPASSPNPADENSRKAKQLIQQGIQALGGDQYLNVRDREQQGRTYGFHAGRPSGGGAKFWSFSQFPDKERVELTEQRDVAELFIGEKGYEITYKGPRSMEQKDLIDYLRRRKFSLDIILRNWLNDPGVIFLYEGNAIAAQHPALKVTLINAKDESVSLFFDADTHLPIERSFEWRDPVDRQKNLEEEVYENYRLVSGIMAPYNITRFFNGDMSSQRFLNSVTINQGLDQAMFDPNSGYNPNKPAKR